MEAAGLRYVGAGVSGGEEGARHGPSIMPGGTADAWPHIATMLQGIAATAGPDDDEPCCDWIGPGGSGHFVKMVHNGIEYGDMQVLAEAYAVLSAQGIAPARHGRRSSAGGTRAGCSPISSRSPPTSSRRPRTTALPSST